MADKGINRADDIGTTDSMDTPLDTNLSIPDSGLSLAGRENILSRLNALSLTGSAAAGLPVAVDEVALLELLRQQESAVVGLFSSLGGGPATAQSLDPLAVSGSSDTITDPKGAAIDFLLGGPTPGAGEIFNLALPDFSSSTSIPLLSEANVAGAARAYREADALLQLLEAARQSNLTILLSIGGGDFDPGKLL